MVVEDPLTRLTAEERGLVKPAPAPRTAGAMKAVLTDERFSDPNWVYERKLDGIRCIAIRSGKDLTLLSRNDLRQNERYPELAEALSAERCEQFAIDGEVVAFEGSQTSFARLAQRHQHYVPVFLYVFDVLWLDGHDVRPLPPAQSQAAAEERAPVPRPRALDPVPQRRRRGAIQRGLPQGLGGPDRQARGQPIRHHALARTG